jgi:uncharacterized membrane protein YfbV (UPF0208 family)
MGVVVMDGRVVRIMQKTCRILTIFGIALFVVVKAEKYSGTPDGTLMPVVLCAVLSVFLFLTGIFWALEDEPEGG